MSSIEDRYRQLGGDRSFLGRALGEERTGADGAGRLRHFEGGLIVAHPKVGTYALHGEVLPAWTATGAETGELGYPTSDVLTAGDGPGNCACFQRGRIYVDWHRGTHITDLGSDTANLDWIAFNAVPLPKDWATVNGFATKMPPSIDYSGDVVFARTQGTRGGAGYGCITYSFLHILDILKNWEHPYSPSASWHYAEWFCKSDEITHPSDDRLRKLGDHGVGSEGHCHTNFDTDFAFVFSSKEDGAPFASWTEPNAVAKDEAPIYSVKPETLAPWAAAKPKDTRNGLLSPSVLEIKQLLRSSGPVFAAGVNHAKAIVGYNDLTRQFLVMDSYLHPESGDKNFTRISYELVGPSWLFTIEGDSFISDLDSLKAPDKLRDLFEQQGWPIPNQVNVSKEYEVAGARTLYRIAAAPEHVNEIDVVFLLEQKDGTNTLTVYDDEIAWNYLSVVDFTPIINRLNPKRLDAAHAYTARFRLDGNWRGAFTVHIGVEGESPLTVWTTRGRNLQNVAKTISGTTKVWETPVEVAKCLHIDVPLPEYAPKYWPPRPNRRWVLTVEDHDRDGISGTISEFTLAQRYIHPDCHSVDHYRTRTFGGPVAINLQDPPSGDILVPFSPYDPPAVANPDPGVTRAFIPPGGAVRSPILDRLGTLLRHVILLPVQAIYRRSYRVELDLNASSISLTGTFQIVGRLTSRGTFYFNGSPTPVPNKHVRLMLLDQTTCKPYQWVHVATATTGDNGSVTFDGKLESLGNWVYGIAFYEGGQELASASSEPITLNKQHVTPSFSELTEITMSMIWPWNEGIAAMVEDVTIPTDEVQR